jgi:integrase
VYGSICQPNTLRVRKLYINSVIIPKLGHFKLSQLSRIEYQKFINSLTETFAKKTVQTIHSIFCTAINKAVELEMITHNKYQNIVIKKENDVSDIKRNYLTKEELAVFMKAAKQAPFHHYIIVSLLVRTGMRKREMLALTRDDIDLEKKEIHITKSRNEYGVKPQKQNQVFVLLELITP